MDFNDTTNSATAYGCTGTEKDAGTALLLEFYTRVYPTVDELTLDLDDLEEGELAEIDAELRTEVSALREETGMLEFHANQLRNRANGNNNNNGNTANGNSNASNNMGSTVDALFAGVGGDGGGEGGAGASRSGLHNNNEEASSLFPSTSNPGVVASSGTFGLDSTVVSRRGRGYRRKSQEEGDMLVGVAEKLAMLSKEGERLKQQEDRSTRQAEQVKDLLTATVEEAQRRLQELRLEFRQFCREVLKSNNSHHGSTKGVTAAGGRTAEVATLPDGSIAVEGTACADDLLLYMHRREQTQKSYLDKLSVQCHAAEQDIARAQQQLRQRKAAGEAFNAVDFAQLRIENEQFTERIDKKNSELADLKGTSTRAVQTLNSLMDALNELNTEQTQLKKELRSRGEYLSRCAKEVTVVSAEALSAEKKNQTIKAQHEAVKVPKIEEYIAQTAELFELEKALKNWSRKVEIAEGQVRVLKQQTRKLNEQKDAALAYAESKKKKRQAAVGHSVSARRPTGMSSGAAAAATTGHGSNSNATKNDAGNAVVVGGTKSLLQLKRNTGRNSSAAAAPAVAAGPSTTTSAADAPSSSPSQPALAPLGVEVQQSDSVNNNDRGSGEASAAADSADAGVQDILDDASNGDAETTKWVAGAPTLPPESPSRMRVPASISSSGTAAEKPSGEEN